MDETEEDFTKIRRNVMVYCFIFSLFILSESPKSDEIDVLGLSINLNITYVYLSAILLWLYFSVRFHQSLWETDHKKSINSYSHTYAMGMIRKHAISEVENKTPNGSVFELDSADLTKKDELGHHFKVDYFIHTQKEPGTTLTQRGSQNITIDNNSVSEFIKSGKKEYAMRSTYFTEYYLPYIAIFMPPFVFSAKHAITYAFSLFK